MKRITSSVAGFVLLGATLLPAASAAAAEPRAPFITSARPLLISTDPGTTITPILTAGEVIGGKLGGFQFSGVPDGIGAYASAMGRLEVFVNHETAHAYGDMSDARVSHLTLNGHGRVVSASYAVDGTEGYQYFCSSTLDFVRGTPWYFTGEEWIGTPKGGISIAINAVTGRVVETPHFGHLNHENVVPIKGLSKAVTFLAEDSFRLRSQAYAYFSHTFAKGIRGKGSFTVWVPDGPVDGDPSTDDIVEGETLAGRFVSIPHAARYTGLELNAIAEDLGSFNFVRIEDAAHDPGNPGVIYLSDTGSNKAESKNGRLYRLTVDPVHPRRASLEVVLDGDAGDDIVNPDNLGINDTTLVIQEDRNKASSGYARVLTYDLDTEALAPVARLDPSQRAIEAGGGPGVWESSGVIDVSAFFGPGSWLLDAQAHDTSVRQQGPSLKIDSGKGERGQLLLVHIAGT
ncbi:MAG: hypothetical protein ABWZ53_07250 [Actinomycetota bacterium]